MIKYLNFLGDIFSRLGSGVRAGAPKVRLYETDLGQFHLLENDALSRHMISGDLHEPHFYTLAKAVLHDDDHVLDLGANFGSHSVFLSGRVPKGHVHSFEPLGLTHSQLALNLVANGRRNVTAYKLAVSDRTGDLVQMQSVDWTSKSLNVGATRVGGKGEAALTLRIDDLGLKPIAFIKMDIQGSETAALRGMAELVARDRPLIFVEIEEKHLRACGSSSKELMELLLGWDYCLYRILTDYPCDHLAVPKAQVDWFEREIADGLGLKLQKIEGSAVELWFSDCAYTYSAIETR